jgi:hypothetical protein
MKSAQIFFDLTPLHPTGGRGVFDKEPDFGPLQATRPIPGEPARSPDRSPGGIYHPDHANAWAAMQLLKGEGSDRVFVPDQCSTAIKGINGLSQV